MGFFSRTSPTEDENFDDIELPKSSDIKESPFAPEEPDLDFKVGAKPAAGNRTYGIEDAIRLMKSLPRDNNEVVVTVVKKTLESTKIQVQDIISDATTREDRLRGQHKRLEKEIKNLQEQIAQRNQRISEVLQDLKETTDVRQRLQLGLELDTSDKTDDKKTDPAKSAAPQGAATGPAVRTSIRPQSAEVGSAGANINPGAAGTSASNTSVSNTNTGSSTEASARDRTNHRHNRTN